jgi:hypothetical protein
MVVVVVMGSRHDFDAQKELGADNDSVVHTKHELMGLMTWCGIQG